MGKLVGGAVLLVIAFSLLLAAATVRAQRPGPLSNLLRFAGYAVGLLVVLFATEISNEDQIRGAVLNAIRKGVRDGMVQYSINDISKRTQIANTMEGLVDSALVTRPRAGGGNFRIATVTAFFLRDLQPPPQVVQAINNKIAQEQQIETERHRVEVARLQTEQQRLLNQTLSPEALTKQWIEVLHDMKGSSNLIIFVPTEGGLPLLNIGDLRKNLKP